jgi:regulator of sigma D
VDRSDSAKPDGWQVALPRTFEPRSRKIEQYVSVKPKRSRGAQEYSLDSEGLDEVCQRFADYVAHYGVAYEN